MISYVSPEKTITVHYLRFARLPKVFLAWQCVGDLIARYHLGRDGGKVPVVIFRPPPASPSSILHVVAHIARGLPEESALVIMRSHFATTS